MTTKLLTTAAGFVFALAGCSATTSTDEPAAPQTSAAIDAEVDHCAYGATAGSEQTETSLGTVCVDTYQGSIYRVGNCPAFDVHLDLPGFDDLVELVGYAPDGGVGWGFVCVSTPEGDA